MHKSITVLRKIEVEHDHEYMPVRFSNTTDGNVTRELQLDRHVWTDMGKPNELTMTIQPGDILNNPTEGDN